MKAFLLLVIIYTSFARSNKILNIQEYILDHMEEDGDELRMLKESMLADLGMSSAPDLSRSNTSKENMEHMLEVYHRSVVEEEIQEEEEEMEEDEGVSRFYSFEEKSTFVHPRHNAFYFFFPVNFTDSINDTTRVLALESAKLRIFTARKGAHHMGQGGRRRWSSYDENEPKEPRGTASVKIFQLLEPPNIRHTRKILLESKDIPLIHESWSPFNVQRAVQSWIDDPNTNFGLLLECSGCEDFVFLTSDAVNQYHQFEDEISGKVTNKKAILDVFLLETTSRLKRSRHSKLNNERKFKLDCTDGTETKLCCRYSMWVSFKELGWDWIVKPEGFEAYFCKGKCPQKYKNYSTTHALIQSILSADENKDLPRPCCAPRKTVALNLLHYNDKDPPELVVTRQKGMIVRECACS